MSDPNWCQSIELGILMEDLIWYDDDEVQKAKIRIPVLMPLLQGETAEKRKEIYSVKGLHSIDKNRNTVLRTQNYVELPLPLHLVPRHRTYYNESDKQYYFYIPRGTEFIIGFIGNKIYVEDMCILSIHQK